ncbi:hypothetical protein [Kibdelosporangium aridum]|uniref:hypothetical protein n=1 Tax=Kibdelosporangium aridum TaxID=2030 RepID=UPI000A050164|nr:hypothetical protein [Kibdelosporangium aridum]
MTLSPVSQVHVIYDEQDRGRGSQVVAQRRACRAAGLTTPGRVFGCRKNLHHYLGETARLWHGRASLAVARGQPYPAHPATPPITTTAEALPCCDVWPTLDGGGSSPEWSP